MIELPEGEVCYAPGDAVGIHCPNHAHLVAQILKRLKLNGSQLFTVEQGLISSLIFH
jgi:sulfite reductase alpha subunit-like flavoprotein